MNRDVGGVSVFDQTIRSLLELYPKGATDDQLIWRLKASGVRVDASELLTGLVRLSERGELIRDSAGRWRAAAHLGILPQGNLNGPQASQQSRNVLTAVPAQCRRALPKAEDIDEQDTSSSKLPAWDSLLAYYASTQRQDPRGKITQFADRHEKSWQLFHTRGSWWLDAEIRVLLSQIPETFREALSRRSVSTAAIGWPLSIFKTRAGTEFIPGLVIPVEWRFEQHDLVISPFTSQPALNPLWLAEIRRATSWTKDGLRERLFPEGEDANLGVVSDRMRLALATVGGSLLRPAELDRELPTTGQGLRNVAGLFLPEDGTFTKGAAEDLERLRTWSPQGREPTALAAVLEATVQQPPTGSASVLSNSLLTDSQRRAAQTALSSSLTVIQGPPGTGKSQVILSLLISAVAAGKTVLLSSKNHQALDEIEHRLKEIAPGVPLLTRGRDSDGERDNSFYDALCEIGKSEERHGIDAAAITRRRNALLDEARALQALRQREDDALQLNLLMSELEDRRARSLTPSQRSWLMRLGALLRRISLRGVVEPVQSISSASDHALEAQIVALRRKLLGIEVPSPQQVEERSKALASDIAALLVHLANYVTQPVEDDRRQAAERARDLEFAQKGKARHMEEADARLVLKHRPIWAVSTLSTPARVPLVPGLFDYVIFDEASQCDIASALPLLARARHGVVVGDPMQLAFVPPLGNAAEHALMDAAGLPKNGRASFAQSINSLFDFCDRRPAAKRMFLSDQFRSAPDIVDYLNAGFYGGRLNARRSDDVFRAPRGYKPGLTWEAVSGHATRHEDGNVNIAEANRIAALLREIANDPDFTGTIGVISPFNSQVGRIRSAVSSVLFEAERERLGLRISTVDKFQGGEADVILFSLVVTGTAPQSARTFLNNERRRLNVAISRARALCIVVGDLDFARTCRIPHIEHLAQRATSPRTTYRAQQYDSFWERLLHEAMKARGIDAHPQFPVGRRYLDFAIDPDGMKLNVEVDGRRWHVDADGNRKVSDTLRDSELQARGWRVRRFWVHELASDMEKCVDEIERELKGRKHG